MAQQAHEVPHYEVSCLVSLRAVVGPWAQPTLAFKPELEHS